MRKQSTSVTGIASPALGDASGVIPVTGFGPLDDQDPGVVPESTRLACRAIAEGWSAFRYACSKRELVRLRRAPLLRVSHRAPQRARTARRAAPRKPAAASGEDSEGEPSPGGVERVGVLTVDPHGRDVVVVLHVDPARTTPAEMVRLARLAVGHRDRGTVGVPRTWQAIVPGASKGGAA